MWYTRGHWSLNSILICLDNKKMIICFFMVWYSIRFRDGSHLNHWLLGIWMKFNLSNFQTNLSNSLLRNLRYCLQIMSLDLIDYKTTSVQVMAWCHQSTSHYLNHCLLRSVTLYGAIKPLWGTRRGYRGFTKSAPLFHQGLHPNKATCYPGVTR